MDPNTAGMEHGDLFRIMVPVPGHGTGGTRHNRESLHSAGVPVEVSEGSTDRQSEQALNQNFYLQLWSKKVIGIIIPICWIIPIPLYGVLFIPEAKSSLNVQTFLPQFDDFDVS